MAKRLLLLHYPPPPLSSCLLRPLQSPALFPPPPPRTYKGYEEVHVPPAPALPPPGEDELVRISQLEDWAQLAFKVGRGGGL